MEKYMVAIHRACNLTFSRFQRLKAHFDNDWERAWKANIKDWQQADIDIKAIETFFVNREKVDPDKEEELLRKCGASVLVYGELNYPTPLLNIYNPPALLFMRGELQPDDFPAIAVVGSRRISNYGVRAAELIVGELADSGVTIVSGLAFGADTVAHKVALEHGTRTIAVLGNGIDVIHPTANQGLAEKFLYDKKGAILSEYLPGSEVRPENFAIRNRIVAGLARATVVLEAAEKSGSLITADLALQHNRELFVVPGEIFSKTSAGCNRLLVEASATPAVSGKQILEQLGMGNLAAKKLAQRAMPTTENERLVLAILERQNKWHIDDLLREVELPGAVTSSVISILEIKGLAQNLGNQMYSSTL